MQTHVWIIGVPFSKVIIDIVFIIIKKNAAGFEPVPICNRSSVLNVMSNEMIEERMA